MRERHKCPYGTIGCGFFGYEDLCAYCKKKADLELEIQRNEVMGQRALERRQQRDAANEALGEFVSEHPVATVLGILGIGLGVAVANNSNKKKEEKKEQVQFGLPPLRNKKRG